MATAVLGPNLQGDVIVAEREPDLSDDIPADWPPPLFCQGFKIVADHRTDSLGFGILGATNLGTGFATLQAVIDGIDSFIDEQQAEAARMGLPCHRGLILHCDASTGEWSAAAGQETVLSGLASETEARRMIDSLLQSRDY